MFLLDTNFANACDLTTFHAPTTTVLCQAYDKCIKLTIPPKKLQVLKAKIAVSTVLVSHC